MGLLVIGGNGSLTGAHLLHQEHGVPVVGLPASIDNDIGCTSFALGVDTALNTIMEACDRISDTASSHRRMFIVEVMGRECGYLAMAASIATAADAVLFREQGKGEDALVEDLRRVIRASFSEERDKKRVLVLKAEGVEVPTAQLVSRLEAHLDDDAPGVGIRATVLGHVVRGGPPSYRDRLLAGRLAYGAVGAVLGGHAGVMAGWEPHGDPGAATPDPSVRLVPLQEVLDQTAALLDGSHPITKRRVRLLEAVQGVLPL
jgi:6-phosphofructokinase 1